MATGFKSSAGVYHFLMLLILFSLLYYGFADKMVAFYDELEQVTESNSKEEFATSISHIRTQWMQSKRLEMEMEVKLVDSADLTSDGRIKVRVNKKGFVVRVLSTTLPQCQGLFQSFQSIDYTKVTVNEIIENQQVIGCEFTKNSRTLFKYMFLNGIVSDKV